MTNVQEDLALAALENYLETKNHSALIKFWQLYPRPIPSWHLPMMNDRSRNEYYRNEINTKASGKRVLDLGSGGGLLIQYSLEAGAEHIYAVEQDPLLQVCLKYAFKKEIAEGRVTLLQMHSQNLKSEHFEKGAPELVIHEIFGRSLFDEKVIESFGDLFDREVLDQSLEFIPQKFSLWGTLHDQKVDTKIDDANYSERFWFLEDITYFGEPITTPDNSSEISEDIKLFEVDLKNFKNAPLETRQTVISAREGNCIRLWFELNGEEANLSTGVRINQDNHWGNAFYFFRFPAGEVNLLSSYSNQKFLFYAKKSF